LQADTANSEKERTLLVKISELLSRYAASAQLVLSVHLLNAQCFEQAYSLQYGLVLFIARILKNIDIFLPVG
jgi:hypothetical protein